MTFLQGVALGLSVSATALAVYAYVLALQTRRGLLRQYVEAREDVVHWAMVAQGINHDRECRNDFTNNDPQARVCLRCECEKLRGEVQALQREIDGWVGAQKALIEGTAEDTERISELQAECEQLRGRLQHLQDRSGQATPEEVIECLRLIVVRAKEHGIAGEVADYELATEQILRGLDEYRSRAGRIVPPDWHGPDEDF